MDSYFKRFLSPAFENKKYIFLLALKSITWNIIQFGWIETARRCVIAIEAKDIESLKFYVLLGLGVSVLGTVWQFTMKQYGRFGILYMLKSIYKFVYQKLTRVDQQAYEEKGTGKIANLIQDGTTAWSGTIDRSVDEGIMFIISFSVAIWYIYSLLGGIYILRGVLIIIIFVLYAGYFEKKLQAPRKERNQVYQEGARHRQKVIMHKQDILINRKEMSERKVQADYYDRIIYYTKKVLFFMTMQNMGLDVKNLILYLLYGYVGIQIIQGNLSIATLTTLVLVLNNVFNQIGVLVTVGQELSDNQFKLKIMNEFLDGPQIIGYEGGKELNYEKQHIECRDISFHYSKGTVIFQDFSLIIAGGKITALVGSSGAGKSTLIKLIAGYLRPNTGSVLVGDRELPHENNVFEGNYISLESYYKHIGYLTQEPSIFDGTIRDNLIYAVSDNASQLEQDGTLSSVISLAQCEWIYNLKDGLDTHIGEKGVKLSGGQRQRLAIAKIMLKNPRIILLDEPTSALDSFAEEEVTKAMNNLFEGRTVIIIAHRLQTVKHADEIIVLGNKEDHFGAQILERGNHESLVNKGGFYAKMLELQSGF